jgi:hypothetical protein
MIVFYLYESNNGWDKNLVELSVVTKISEVQKHVNMDKSLLERREPNKVISYQNKRSSKTWARPNTVVGYQNKRNSKKCKHVQELAGRREPSIVTSCQNKENTKNILQI